MTCMCVVATIRRLRELQSSGHFHLLANTELAMIVWVRLSAGIAAM